MYEKRLDVLLDLLMTTSYRFATMNRSIFRLKSKALDILKEEPNALDLRAPVKIVGDLHGQFFDLISMLDHCGAPGGGCRWSILPVNSQLQLHVPFVDYDEIPSKAVSNVPGFWGIV